MNLYVYYRVEAGKEEACRTAVTALQHELGVPHRLLQRVDDPSTWMEIYEDVEASFAQTLEAAARQHGIPAHLAPESLRHLESFVPCA